MHIAVFFQYYHNPDCPLNGRHYTFVKRWAKRHKVTVITTRIWHEQRLTQNFPWAPEGVDIHMLDIPYDNAMGKVRRFGAFSRYVSGAIRCGLTIPKPDVILGTSTPLTAAWAASRVAKLRRVPWVFEVRDLWPDFPIQMGAVRPRLFRNTLFRMEKRLYHSAAHVVPLSPDMATHVLENGVPANRVTTLLNGTDFPLLDACSNELLDSLRQQYDLIGQRIVLYAGAFGRANAINTLIEAARYLSPRRDISLVVSGHGFHLADIEDASRRIGNIILLPPQPRHQMLCWFKTSDLSLVPFIDRPVLSANSPAKFFDSLGAGTPVIVTNPGWTKHFVEVHECGWFVPPENASALAATIVNLIDEPELLKAAGIKGNRAARSLFDRRRLSDTMEYILNEVAQRSIA